MSTTPFVRNDIIGRMVPHEEAADSVLLGWIPTAGLNGTTHGQWSVLMLWIMCEHPMRIPINGDASA